MTDSDFGNMFSDSLLVKFNWLNQTSSQESRRQDVIVGFPDSGHRNVLYGNIERQKSFDIISCVRTSLQVSNEMSGNLARDKYQPNNEAKNSFYQVY